MYGLFVFLRNLIVFPFEFVADMWVDTGRGRALLLAMPAIIVLAIGGIVFAMAQVSSQPNLENKYDNLAKETHQKAQQIASDLQREIKILGAQRQNKMSGLEDVEFPGLKGDPRIDELKQLRQQETVYLEKLIALNPEDPAYKYRLADLSFTDPREVRRAISLMDILAPDDRANYAKAHFFKASKMLNQMQKSSNPRQVRELRRLAKIHADHCLVLESKNNKALQIKAMLLEVDNPIEAYSIYQDLFSEEPRYYRKLLSINDKKIAQLKRRTSLSQSDLNEIDELEQKNERVLATARDKYQAMTKSLAEIYRNPDSTWGSDDESDKKLNIQDWINAWREYIKVLYRQEDFASCDQALDSELNSVIGHKVYLNNRVGEVQAEIASLSDGDNESKRFEKDVLEKQRRRYEGERSLTIAQENYLQRERAVILTSWAASLGEQQDLEQQLAKLEDALQINSKNENVLRQLTILGIDAPDAAIRERALAIYNPAKDVNPPAAVLDQLGRRAISNEDFVKAISLYERASKRSPNDPMILNNLAYSYLVAESKDPQRALVLIDQAFSQLRSTPADRDRLMSHFYDTRGLALMQLNRMEEAAASLEEALNRRDESDTTGRVRILDNLIKVYTSRGMSEMADSYRRQIGREKERAKDNESIKTSQAGE